MVFGWFNIRVSIEELACAATKLFNFLKEALPKIKTAIELCKTTAMALKVVHENKEAIKKVLRENKDFLASFSTRTVGRALTALGASSCLKVGASEGAEKIVKKVVAEGAEKAATTATKRVLYTTPLSVVTDIAQVGLEIGGTVYTFTACWTCI